jgi:hypothetical protein
MAGIRPHPLKNFQKEVNMRRINLTKLFTYAAKASAAAEKAGEEINIHEALLVGNLSAMYGQDPEYVITTRIERRRVGQPIRGAVPLKEKKEALEFDFWYDRD